MGVEAVQSQNATGNENRKSHAHFVSQDREPEQKLSEGEICEIANLAELFQNHLRFHGCVMAHFLPQCQGAALRGKL